MRVHDGAQKYIRVYKSRIRAKELSHRRQVALMQVSQICDNSFFVPNTAQRISGKSLEGSGEIAKKASKKWLKFYTILFFTICNLKQLKYVSKTTNKGKNRIKSKQKNNKHIPSLVRICLLLKKSICPITKRH